MPLTVADTGQEYAIQRIVGKPEVKQHLNNLGFVVGAPCFAAIGAMKREKNNTKWIWFAIFYQRGFAGGQIDRCASKVHAADIRNPADAVTAVADGFSFTQSGYSFSWCSPPKLHGVILRMKMASIQCRS